MRLDLKLKQITGSRTRAKLIKIFFRGPDESYYVRQLVRLSEEEINSVRRELDNLKKIGALLSVKRSNKLFYWPNKKFIFFAELVMIAFKSKFFFSEIEKYKNKNIGLKKIYCSKNFIYDKEAESEQEVDMVMVGKANLEKIKLIVDREEEKKGREINYMLMGKKEFDLRMAKRDPFMVDFFLKSPILIIGTDV